MSLHRVARKVVKWVEYTPPREWKGVLSCGHEIGGGYDDGLSDETKAVLEAQPTVDCYRCAEEQNEIASMEQRLRDLKARKKATRT